MPKPALDAVKKAMRAEKAGEQEQKNALAELDNALSEFENIDADTITYAAGYSQGPVFRTLIAHAWNRGLLKSAKDGGSNNGNTVAFYCKQAIATGKGRTGQGNWDGLEGALRESMRLDSDELFREWLAFLPDVSPSSNAERIIENVMQVALGTGSIAAIESLAATNIIKNLAEGRPNHEQFADWQEKLTSALGYVMRDKSKDKSKEERIQKIIDLGYKIPTNLLPPWLHEVEDGKMADDSIISLAKALQNKHGVRPGSATFNQPIVRTDYSSPKTASAMMSFALDLERQVKYRSSLAFMLDFHRATESARIFSSAELPKKAELLKSLLDLDVFTRENIMDAQQFLEKQQRSFERKEKSLQRRDPTEAKRITAILEDMKACHVLIADRLGMSPQDIAHRPPPRRQRLGKLAKDAARNAATRAATMLASKTEYLPWSGRAQYKRLTNSPDPVRKSTIAKANKASQKKVEPEEQTKKPGKGPLT